MGGFEVDAESKLSNNADAQDAGRFLWREIKSEIQHTFFRDHFHCSVFIRARTCFKLVHSHFVIQLIILQHV